jgi:hypothetical protein
MSTRDGAPGAVARARVPPWQTWALLALVAFYLGAGLVITAVLEALNVYVWGRWAYTTRMPRAFGLGVGPLLQWLVVPPLTLSLTRWLLRARAAFKTTNQET